MSKALRSLGEATRQRMELDLTHRFTFGTATSYTDLDGETVSTTVGDGLALFSASHTVPDSSTTYRNIVANNPVFSRGGLEAAPAKIMSSPLHFSLIPESDPQEQKRIITDNITYSMEFTT